MERRLARVYVIGMGEVGSRLAAALERGGATVVPVTRDRGWNEAAGRGDGLRLVCVREESLAEVLRRLRGVPPHRLVFIQNGWIRPLLEGAAGSSRGLIWFTSKGEFFKQLRPSPFTGPAAAALARPLTIGGIDTWVADRNEFTAREADKMGFNCVVGLPLAVRGLSLGEYLEQHTDEARGLFEESTGVVAEALGQTLDPGWWPAFVESVQPLAWVRASSAKALEFRSGAVSKLARQLNRPVPVTDRLLAAAQAA